MSSGEFFCGSVYFEGLRVIVRLAQNTEVAVTVSVGLVSRTCRECQSIHFNQFQSINPPGPCISHYSHPPKNLQL